MFRVRLKSPLEESRPGDAIRPAGHWIILLVAAFAIVATSGMVYSHPPSLSLDGSWTLSVQRLATDFRIFDGGYSFTYGQLMPLQYTTPATALVGLGFFFCTSAYVGFRTATVFGPWPVAALLMAYAFGKHFDALVLMTFFACLTACCSRRTDFILLIVIALLCHVKYSMIIMAAAALIVTDLWILFVRKEGRPLNTVTFLAAFSGVFLAFGGSPFGLGDFLANLASIILAYNEAMAVYYVPALSIFLYCAGGWLAISAAVIAVNRKSASPIFASDKTLALLIFALGLFVAVKSGYTRADGHILYAWNTTAILFLTMSSFLFWFAPGNRRGQITLAAVGFLAILIGPFVAPKPSYFTANGPAISVELRFWNKLSDAAINPEARQRTREMRDALTVEARKRLAAAGLADLRVDAYPTQIGDLALAATHYANRPVIQMYSSYDKRLQTIDAEYLDSNGPDAILMYPIVDIDDRLPGHLLGPSYFSILANYYQTCTEYRQPQTEELATVWLRRPEPADLKLSFGDEQKAELGAWIDIDPTHRSNGKRPVARVDVHTRLTSQFIGLAFKPSMLLIDVEYEEGSVRTYRFIRKAGQISFPLLPLGTQHLSGGQEAAGPLPVRFRLHEKADYLPYYAKPFEYALGDYVMPEDGGLDRADQCLRARLRSALSPPHIDMTSTNTIFAHAASSVSVEVYPDEQVSVSAIMPDDAFPCSDGVLFQVLEQTGDGTPNLVWETTITQPGSAQSPPNAAYTAPSEGAFLSLTTIPLQSAACDWSSWQVEWKKGSNLP